MKSLRRWLFPIIMFAIAFLLLLVVTDTIKIL
jgi:hypothetical protein